MKPNNCWICRRDIKSGRFVELAGFAHEKCWRMRYGKKIAVPEQLTNAIEIDELTDPKRFADLPPIDGLYIQQWSYVVASNGEIVA